MSDSKKPFFSIPSPLHFKAAHVVEQFSKRKGSLKNLTLSSKSVPPSLRKAVYALSLNVIRYHFILNDIKSRIFIKSDKLTKYMINVLIYDMTLGELSSSDCSASDLKCSPHAANIWNQRRVMRQVVEDALLVAKVSSPEELLPEPIRDINKSRGTKWIRMNLLRDLSPLEIATEFNASPDPLVPGLFYLSDDISVHNHPRVLSFDVVPQNKSSCLPVVALNPPPNAVCLDACSAPGSKTCQLLSWKNRPSKVIAVELSEQRFDLLQSNLIAYTSPPSKDVPSVDMVPASFLDIEPEESPFASVEYILVDAQCSGSGNSKVNMDALLGQFLKSDGQEDFVVKKLPSRLLNDIVDNQIDLVSHALAFPSAKKVVYSTCSIYEEENELVVSKILLRHNNWTLERILPSFPGRGNTQHGKLMDHCVFCEGDDSRDGFFVASFVRKDV
ncbi:hypothetical protein P9112_003200 [Eukaryota sp. TZLM1-RC]